MRITKLNSDLINLNENNYKSKKYLRIKKVHLIKLDFCFPNNEVIREVLNSYPKTNRFIIEKNIKEYNNLLRKTEKKYYVMNRKGSNIISFLRKNNKILLNFNNLREEERNFFINDFVFIDILKNTEVIALDEKIYDKIYELLDNWNGNVVILKNKEKI